jgi:hypothetical protein
MPLWLSLSRSRDSVSFCDSTMSSYLRKLVNRRCLFVLSAGQTDSSTRWFSSAATRNGQHDWRWRTNFHKDRWNDDSFGPVRHDRCASLSKVNRSGSDVASSSHWTGVVDRADAKRKKTKKNGKKPNDGSSQAALEEAIASASLELTEKANKRVQNLPDGGHARANHRGLPAVGLAKDPKGAEEAVSSLPTHSFQPRPSQVLSAKDLDESIVTLKAALNDAKNVPKTRGWPSVTKVLAETMPQEDRLRLQVWEEQMKRQLGVEGFFRMRQETLTRGKRLHAFIEATLMQDDDKVS